MKLMTWCNINKWLRKINFYAVTIGVILVMTFAISRQSVFTFIIAILAIMALLWVLRKFTEVIIEYKLLSEVNKEFNRYGNATYAVSIQTLDNDAQTVHYVIHIMKKPNNDIYTKLENLRELMQKAMDRTVNITCEYI